MQKEKTIAGHKARFLALGYAESLAEETASALVNGEAEKVFQNQKKFLEAHDKAFEADLLKGTPRPQAGSVGDNAVTLEDFRKMSVQERYSFSEQHPEEYKNLYGGNT